MKWIKASERLPEDYKPTELIIVRIDNGAGKKVPWVCTFNKEEKAFYFEDLSPRQSEEDLSTIEWLDESPSPPPLSDKPVVGKSNEQLEILADEIANKNLRYGGDEPAEYNAYVNGIKDGLTYNVDQALPVKSDAVDKPLYEIMWHKFDELKALLAHIMLVTIPNPSHQVPDEVEEDWTNAGTLIYEIEQSKVTLPVVVDAVIHSIEQMKDDSGREGCTYGDTNYDSPSAVYGYNLAIDNIVSFLKQQS